MLRAVEDALMPLRCVFCGTRTHAGKRYLCPGCDDDLPRIDSPPPAVSSPFACERAPLAYQFPVDAAIKALKFKRRLFYVPAFASLLCRESDHLPADIDAVVPVPLHWRRQWVRGFNQALEIGKPLARHLNVPMLRNVVRRRATPSQSGLKASERARNLRAAFAVRGSISCRHVLIVDDVITTGVTLREVARAVKKAGAGKVSALAIARA